MAAEMRREHRSFARNTRTFPVEHPHPVTSAIDPVAELARVLDDAAAELAGDHSNPSGARLSRPPKPEFGDYSSNAPMLLAPVLGEPPRAVAERLGALATEKLGASLDRADVA